MNNTLASKKQNVEYYRIYNIATTASKQTVAKAATDGLGQNTKDINTTMPIPASAEPPDRPGRFKVVNPLAGTKLGALATVGGGFGMKMADCEGAAWTGKAVRQISGSNTLKSLDLPVSVQGRVPPRHVRYLHEGRGRIE